MVDEPLEDFTNIELEMEELGSTVQAEVTAITDNNIGDMGDIQNEGMSLRSFGLIILGIGFTFTLMGTGMLTMWCKRNYKQYYFEEQNRLRELDQENHEQQI